MSLIIDGILTQKLPWGLVLLGVAISIVLELCGIASLPFAVGVYLPLSSSTPIFVGGLLRWLADKWTGKKAADDSDSSPGVLLSSGLIAGGSIAGIGLAIVSIYESAGNALDLSKVFPTLASSNLFAVSMFALLCIFTLLVGAGKFLKPKA